MSLRNPTRATRTARSASTEHSAAEAEARASAGTGIDLAGIVAALEEDIVFGRLHPRERLVEDRLMERFDAKRHLLRDAFAALDHMGLVERQKNIGAVVRSFSTDDVTQLYAMRRLLETEAARAIPLPVSEERLAPLRAIQAAHDQAIASADLRGVYRSNQAFHHALFELAGNRVLQQAIADYARRTHAMRFVTLAAAEYRQRSSREHHAMLDALRAGDRKALLKLCGDHLQPSRDAYLALQRMSNTSA